MITMLIGTSRLGNLNIGIWKLVQESVLMHIGQDIGYQYVVEGTSLSRVLE